MSFFVATCPKCGNTYTHLFVGSTLYSGHICPKDAEALKALTTPPPRQP